MNLKNVKMEILIFFFLIIICLLLYYKSIIQRKRYIQKANYFRKEIEILKSKILFLESKSDSNSVNSININDLSSQLIGLHKALLEKHLK